MAHRLSLSRRALVASGLALAAGTHAFAQLATAAQKANAPVIPKRVVRLFNTRPRIREPNDHQFSPDGKLWVLDQVDQPTNKVFTLDPATGAVLGEVMTQGLHASGITLGDGAWWIGSTKGHPGEPPMTYKVDPATGRTLASYITPESGKWNPNMDTPSGAHGIKWDNGKYWMAVPYAHKIFLMDPEPGRIDRFIPAPTIRTHGIAVEGDHLWCIGTGEREIYKLQKSDGKIVGKIVIPRDEPEPHGLDIWKGELWYCDAASGWFAKLV